MVKPLLNDEAKARLEAAIAQAEGRTSGEIVVCIARRSGQYRSALLLVAGALTLSVPLIVHTAGWMLSGLAMFALQAVVFFLVAAAAEALGLQHLFVPRSRCAEQAAQAARTQFSQLGLHRTARRTGVLLYLSEAEHHAEIIADSGIHAKAPPGTWDAIIRQLVARLRAGEAEAGLVEAVTACADMMAVHFPLLPNDRNELPNEVLFR